MTTKLLDSWKNSKPLSQLQREKQELAMEISHVVDRILTCPANQVDGLTRKLFLLQKKRNALPKTASSGTTTTTTTAPAVASESIPTLSEEGRDSITPSVAPVSSKGRNLNGSFTPTPENVEDSEPGKRFAEMQRKYRERRNRNGDSGLVVLEGPSSGTVRKGESEDE